MDQGPLKWTQINQRQIGDHEAGWTPALRETPPARKNGQNRGAVAGQIKVTVSYLSNLGKP